MPLWPCQRINPAPRRFHDDLTRRSAASLDDLLRIGAPNQARKGQVPAIVFVTKYRLAVEEKRTLRLAVGLAGGVTSTDQPLPAIILDLVHWSVAHGRFSELRALVRQERPHLFED